MMHKFKTLCITGGEPLLEPLKIYKVLRAAKYGSKEMPLVVLYTNGALMTSTVAKIFEFWGINAMNVGLHVPSTFDAIIKRCTLATKDTNLTIRFHAQDVYAEQLTTAHPTVNFKFWKLNDCDRENEMRVVLVD
jgi:sulfatase maturation enzyme AslB (radical SAM superfamily)